MKYVKRINNELDLLQCHYVIHVEYMTNNHIHISLYDEQNRVMIVYLNQQFPFKCPSVKLKNKDNEVRCMYQVYQHLSLFYIKHMEQLKEMKSYCFCCCNISNFWNPGNRILDVVKECKNIEYWFQCVRSGYFGEKILSKILIKDIACNISTFIYAKHPTLY